jgi:DNA-binding MarR family transcriptional regulator
MNHDIHQLHGALLDIIGFFNQPKGDEDLIQESGISLDRALFPLLVRIERRGPIGIVDLANTIGRDYTTVSRQVSKLQSLGLAMRQESKEDRRVSKVSVTKKGLKLTAEIDTARDRLMSELFKGWSERDRKSLSRLTRRLADELTSIS